MKKSLLLPLAISMLSSSGWAMDPPEKKTTVPCRLTLVRCEDPILHKPTQPVVFPLSEEDKTVIQNMLFSIQPQQLKEANAPWESAAGMAANQWGKNKSIFLFCPDGNSNEKGEVTNIKVVINPTYEALNDLGADSPSQSLAWEGCFSLPLAAGEVNAYNHIKVCYQNEAGEHITEILEGWNARVWQHENNHLRGHLYDDERAKFVLRKKFFHLKTKKLNFMKK